MFYVVTEQGISITEAGKKPLFISKSDRNFEKIKNNIENVDYNTVKAMTDVKSQITGFINENIETYTNSDGNLEMNIKLNDDIRELIRSYIITNVLDGRSNNNLTNRESVFIELLETNAIRLVNIKGVFE